jgi:hypothetical protein
MIVAVLYRVAHASKDNKVFVLLYVRHAYKLFVTF